jgi:hypothetical protein
MGMSSQGFLLHLSKTCLRVFIGVFVSFAAIHADAFADDGRLPTAFPALKSPPPLELRLEWHRAPLGEGIGASGLYVVDLDADGDRELVASARFGPTFTNNRWYIAEMRFGGYEPVWLSASHARSITGIQVANVDADAAQEVLVAHGSEVLVYDGATRLLQHTISTALYEIASFMAIDLDSDATLELVLCDAEGTHVLDYFTGAQEWARVGYGESRLRWGTSTPTPSSRS